MQRHITRGAAANAGLLFHVFVQDSTVATGAGKASLAFSDFACRYIRNGEAISGAITPQDITTIGTYAAPTANTNIRIKAVDNTNMIGIYEVQIHLDWVNTTNSCQSLTIYLSATGAAVRPFTIPLVAYNPQDAAGLGLTNLNATVSSRMATYTQPTGFLATSFPTGTVASTTNITAIGTCNVLAAGAIDASVFISGAINAAALAADASAEIADAVWDEVIAGHLTAGTTGNALNAAGSAGDPWTTPLPGAYGAGTAGKIIADILVDTAVIGAAGAGLTAVPWNAAWDAQVESEVVDGLNAYDVPTTTQLTASVSTIDFNVTAILADTNELQTDWVDGGRLDLILDTVSTLPTATQNADALLKRDWTSVTGEAARSMLNALRFLRNKWSVTGSTLTVTKEDDLATAWTSAVTSNAAADPITGSDPT